MNNHMQCLLIFVIDDFSGLLSHECVFLSKDSVSVLITYKIFINSN